MKGHGEKLTRKQELAIIALLNHSTIEGAAKSINIGPATLWRWMQLADFNESYLQAKRKILNQAINRLQQISSDAVKTLGDILNDSNARAPVKIAAARLILELSIKAFETQELEARILKLEEDSLKGGLIHEIK